MLLDGIPTPIVSEQLGIVEQTLNRWHREQKKTQPGYEPQPVCHPNACRVGEVRRILSMLDEGMSVKRIERETTHTRQTIRRWRDDPRFRDATFEYDPNFNYDHTDLEDRAVVAHHLCTQTTDVGERLDLVMAVAGVGVETDKFSVPRKTSTRRKVMR